MAALPVFKQQLEAQSGVAELVDVSKIHLLVALLKSEEDHIMEAAVALAGAVSGLAMLSGLEQLGGLLVRTHLARGPVLVQPEAIQGLRGR